MSREPIFARDSHIGLPLVVAAVIAVVSVLQWTGPLAWSMAFTVLQVGNPAGVNWSALLLHVFTHSGWTHLLFNMGALIVMGAGVVRGWGGPVFLLAMMGGAISGAGLELVMARGPVFLAGASTAVSAVFAMALLYVNRQAPLSRRILLVGGFLIVLVAIDLLINTTGMLGPGQVAVLGHAGGFLFGALLALVWPQRRRERVIAAPIEGGPTLH